MTEADAQDVVELLVGATRAAFTSDLGVVDGGRRSGTSVGKQVS